MSFITDIDFGRVINHPISLPHTEVEAGQTIVISTIYVEEGKKIDLTWLNLHVPRIAPSTRSSRLVYASQAETSVTSNDDFFVQEDIGAVIRWASGEEAVVTDYIGPTELAVGSSQTVSNGYFEMIGSTARLINSGFGSVYVGVYTEQFSRMNRPTGDPLFYLTLDSPGVESLPVRSHRIVYGPDIVSVAVTNNTHNINLIEAVVTGSFKAYV